MVDPVLATADDVAAQLGRDLTSDEQNRVYGLLRLASSLVRAYTRQHFSPVTETVKLRSVSAQVKLPQRPVTNVVSVYAILRDGQLVALPLWYFDGIDTIGGVAVSDDIVINLPSWYTTWWTGSVQVTYTHGYDPIPTDVVDVTASAVYRLFNAPGSGATGISSERVGRLFEYQLADGTDSGQVVLTATDKLILNRYRINSRSIEIRS